MVDFKNGILYKLKKSPMITHAADLHPLLVDGEQILSEYVAARDYIVFTTKRIIAVNVQGLSGKKVDFTSLPYSKIQVFSVETAGNFDIDAELEMYFSGLGKVRFEIFGANDIKEIGKFISNMVL